MSSVDYRARRAELTAQVEEFERTSAPSEHLAAALANLVVLDLDFEEREAARGALSSLAQLRKSSPEAEAVYYVSASRLAQAEGEAARAAWLAEHGVSTARKHVPAYLPHALLQLSDALCAAGRAEAGGWARAEAVERFEATGWFGYAASALLSWTPEVDEPDPSRLQRAVALAERGDWGFGVGWALRRLAEWHDERGSTSRRGTRSSAR